MNHFRIGGKAVCIAHGPWYRAEGGRWVLSPNPPVFNQTYTVAGFRDLVMGLGLIFEEIGADPIDGVPWSYNAQAFRPLIETKTDIGTLTALLDPANHKPLEVIAPTPGDRVRPAPVPVR